MVAEDSGRDVVTPGAWHVIAVVVQLAAKAKDASLVVFIDGVSLPAFRHTELCDLSPVRAELVYGLRRVSEIVHSRLFLLCMIACCADRCICAA